MNLDDYKNEEELRSALNRALRLLADSKDRSEQLVRAVQQAAKDSIAADPWKPVPAPKLDRRAARSEAALWHLTDWQGSKQTVSYDSTIMRRRVEQFWGRAQRITEIQRADHPVRECVILFGGDMVEGMWNFPTQVFEIDATITEQWRTVSRLLVDTVRFALSVYAKVTVVGEWGNHGRIGSNRAVVPRADNFDRICYETARERLHEETRLVWQDSTDDIQRVEIDNYKALLCHGDEIGRNGFASFNTILQWANRQRSGAFKWDFRDIYIGHYHTHAEQTLANGEGALYHTGSTESDNRYARDQLAASAIPSQRLHFIDPRKGRVTAVYKVWLD